MAKIIIGIITRSEKFLRYRKKKFFRKSFRPSIKGWRIPRILVLLGLFRIWLYPKIFRSRMVKKATARRIRTIMRMLLKK
jgi:hypothetical protein